MSDSPLEKRTALIAGATGLTGSRLLMLLLKSDYYQKVNAIGRKEVDLNSSPFASSNIQQDKLEQLIVDFDNLNNSTGFLKADDIFCCLGTTIKKAGSEENFKKVDFDYPVGLAKICLENGAKQFSVMSSVGADPSSKIFYTRVKGTMEDEIMKLNYRGINIFRPSFLLGEREEKRMKENIAASFYKAFSFLLIKKLKKYRAIKALDVAKAMVIAAKENHKGIDVFESDRIQSLADMKPL